MATKTTTPSGLSSIANTVSNVASQVSKGGMTQAQINSAISSLQGAQSQLSSGVSSGQYQSGVNYSGLDNAVQSASAVTGVPSTKTAVITPQSITTPTPTIPIFQNGLDYNNLLPKTPITTDTTAIGTIDPSINAINQSQTNQMANIKDVFNQIGAPRSIEAEMRNSPEQQAVNQANQRVADLSGQLAQITNHGQAAQLSVVGQGRGIPEAIIGGQQAQIARETAIQALPVSAQLQWAQGNADAANKTLDRLYQYRSQDIQNEYNYKVTLGTQLLNVANTSEQAKLKLVLDKEAQKTQQAQDNLKFAREMQSLALKTNQGDLVSQFASLDPKSQTFSQDIAKIQAKIVDPTAALDLALKKAQLTKALAPNTQIVDEGGKKFLINSDTGAVIRKYDDMIPASTKAPDIQKINGQDMQWDGTKWINAVTGSAPQNQALITAAKEKTALLDTLKESPGLNGVVGPNMFARFAPQEGNWFTGVQGDFIAGVTQATNQATVDNLVNIKKAGGTFGALSEKELSLLEQSATKINSWKQINSDGQVTGYKTTEKAFKDALDELKTHINNFVNADGGLAPDITQNYLNTVTNTIPSTVNPYSSAGYILK